MPLAIFGIESTAANLVVTGAILSLVAIWLALIVFTWNDSRRRIDDPFLVGCATAASVLFPFVGTIVYTIVRPGEFLEDTRERDLEVRDTEARLRHHKANSCRKCGAPAGPDFVRCPNCRTRLKNPCPSCSRPVGLDWKVCPYCEKTLIEPKRSSKRGSSKSDEKGSRRRRKSAASKPESGEPSESSRRRSRSTTKSGASAGGAEKERGDSGASERRSDSADPARRSPESSRRKVVVADDDPGSKPINTGSKPINRGDGDAKGEEDKPR